MPSPGAAAQTFDVRGPGAGSLGGWASLGLVVVGSGLALAAAARVFAGRDA